MTCDHLTREGLLARELGLPDDHVTSCGDCQAELDRYRFVLDLPGLVDTSPSPPGWQRRVWAAIDQLERPWWRRWLTAQRRWLWGPAVVALATVLLLVLVRPPRAAPVGPELELTVHRAAPLGLPTRSVSALVGDQIEAQGRRADAIWVYGEAGNLLARCPGSEACALGPRGLVLTFRIDAPGRHRALAVSGAPDLEPTGDFDRDVLAARARGARLELRSVLGRPVP